MTTTSADRIRPVGTTEVWISMIVYTLLYGVLAVIEVKLFLDYIKKGPEPFEEPTQLRDDDELAFAY